MVSNKRVKKIFAREFLILVGALIVCCLIALALILRDWYFKNQEIASYKISESIMDSIEVYKSTYSNKISNQSDIYLDVFMPIKEAANPFIIKNKKIDKPIAKEFDKTNNRINSSKNPFLAALTELGNKQQLMGNKQQLIGGIILGQLEKNDKRVWMDTLMYPVFKQVKNEDDFWQYLTQMVNSEIIDSVYNSDWAQNFVYLFPQVGIDSLPDLKLYIEMNTISEIDSLNYSKIDSLTELRDIYLEKSQNWAKYYQYYYEDPFIIAMISAIILIIAFPFRYFILLLIWSIRTVRTKE